MSARKDDAGKPPISLIPRSGLLAVARVMAKGKIKYGAQNWRSGGGMDWSRLLDAALRHVLAFADGEDYDTGEGGSEELHLANAICCLMFLIEYYEKGIGKDDRFTGEAPKKAAAPIDTCWVVYAEGGMGPPVRLINCLTKFEAEMYVAREKANWPTFTLVMEEEPNAGHSATA